MRITVEKYAVTNPKWKGPSERFKVLSKRFCCDAMRDIEGHLRMDNRWPPRLTFWIEPDDEDGAMGAAAVNEAAEVFDMNFCPGCGEKVEFVEEKAT